MSEPTTIAEKLRWIADYIDECDSLVGNVLLRAREQGKANVTDEELQFIAGKEAQRDLRAWAEILEGGGSL